MRGGFWFIVAIGALVGIWFNASNLFPGSRPAPTEQADLVVGMGQHLAIQTLADERYGVVSHDAYGRNRDGDDLDWIVCAQHTRSDKITVDLAVAPIGEGCPKGSPIDRGTPHVVKVGDKMPDLINPVNRTAYMVDLDFPDASLIFMHQGRKIDSNLQDYKVCTQSIPYLVQWDGQPLTFDVTGYEQACAGGAA